MIIYRCLISLILVLTSLQGPVPILLTQHQGQCLASRRSPVIAEYMEELSWDFGLLFSLLAFKPMEVVAFLLEQPALGS